MQEQVTNIAKPKTKWWPAYNIVRKEGSEKAYWNRVGTAFWNKDGSINVVLEAVPVDGKVHLREPSEDRGPLGRAADRGELPRGGDRGDLP